MESAGDSPVVRKGRFLWMAKAAQEQYLRNLRTQVAEGFFWSDAILSRVVDEIAPVFDEAVRGEMR